MGSDVWRATTKQWMLSFSHSTALVKNTPVRGTLLQEDVIWGPSNVQLRNANGLAIPSGRKVMVSYDVLGPGGRVILHA